MTKHSVDDLKRAVPGDAVRAAFMRREDIAALPLSERAVRWTEHAKRVDEFFGVIAALDTTIIILPPS